MRRFHRRNDMASAMKVQGAEEAGASAEHGIAAPKWAQSRTPAGKVLVRDYNDPKDIALAPDEVIDLADGNVFRTVPGCDSPATVRSTAPPKLMFVVDDAWELTTNPHQTLETLRGLFDLPADQE